jgi:uncharacterized membrane-anchored protein YhcB (DUF1043 family)
MVSWIWLLVALWAGVFAGIFIASLLRAARSGEQELDNELPTLRTH